MRGYKICKTDSNTLDFNKTNYFTIVELDIPEDAAMVEGEMELILHTEYGDVLRTLKKYRASKAVVAKIHGGGKFEFNAAYSLHGTSLNCYNSSVVLEYVVGQTVVPKEPFSETDEACDSGIHFFASKQDALDFIHNRIECANMWGMGLSVEIIEDKE